jgi:hypothetical protein
MRPGTPIIEVLTMQARHTPTLSDFVDDEMLRAPLLFDQVIDAVVEQWRLAIGASLRHGTDTARVLQNHRSELVSEAVRSLRQQVRGAQATTAPASASSPAPTARLELSLIGEDEVTADIEVSRAVERIKSLAEFELRELQAYTSALVGDFNVSKDTNPFRPEAYVRALSDGAQSLPLSRSAQAAFMHDAADPLARTLRQGYAAACTRLDDQGVEPAVYRTIVVSPSLRGGSAEQTLAVGVSLQEIRDSMPMPLDEPTSGAQGALSGGPRVDQQLVDLLSRLFDAIQSDRHLPPACLALLLRLHPTALRLAVHDTTMLDDYDHPVWRFMDRLAFAISTAHVLENDRWLNFARQLVDHLVGDGAADTARFEWALTRIEAYERHCFERAVLVAQPEITNLQVAPDRSAQPIDVGTMDTVPAELLHEPGPVPSPTGPRLQLQPGQHMRAYLQGDWRQLQLLWMDDLGEVWLLADAAAPRHWALRRSAVERLAAENLAVPLRPRSLVRSAADRMLRSMPPTPA